jgi:hypothetical protein
MNPFADLHDWKDASAKALQLQTKYQTNAIAVGNWSLVSRLAWYAQKTDPSARALSLDNKNKQFTIWYGRAKANQSLIWIDWSEMRQKTPSGCQKIDGELGRYIGKHSHFDFYYCPPAVN